MDFIKGVLTIDTINANHINNADDNEGNLEDNNSNSEFDILSKPTYFSNGLKIISAKKLVKLMGTLKQIIINENLLMKILKLEDFLLQS